jgi:hypothetical protein
MLRRVVLLAKSLCLELVLALCAQETVCRRVDMPISCRFVSKYQVAVLTFMDVVIGIVGF